MTLELLVGYSESPEGTRDRKACGASTYDAYFQR
jgi:hypothetical protein